MESGRYDGVNRGYYFQGLMAWHRRALISRVDALHA